MKLRKRLVFGAVVLLSLAALVLAVVAMFFKSSVYDEAWIVTIFSGLLWGMVACFVDAECEGDTQQEIDDAKASEKRHLIPAAVAIIIAVALLFVGLITRSVWSYVEDEGFKVNKLVVGEIDATNLNVTEANATELYVTDAHATNLYVTEAHATEVYVTNAYATKVYATEVYATKVEASEVYATKVEASEVYATKVEASEVHADKGIFNNIFGNIGSGGSNYNPKPVITQKPIEDTQKPTEVIKPTDKNEEPVTEPQKPSLEIISDKRDRYDEAVMRTIEDKVTIKIFNCSISDIDYYWVKPGTEEKQTEGVSLVKISEGEYSLVIADWVFNSAEDIQIKNPATRNQYYTVTIEREY